MSESLDPLRTMYETKRAAKRAPAPEPVEPEKPAAPDLGQGARGVNPLAPGSPSPGDWFMAAGRAARHKSSINDELDRINGER